MNNLQTQIDKYLTDKDYSKAADLYEQLIAEEPEERSYYWHLGLMFLLQGKEGEAQATWFLPMSVADIDEIEVFNQELITVLQEEVKRQEKLEDYQLAWVIRQHIKELDPTDVNNQLCIILLSLKLETYHPQDLEESRIIELLETEKNHLHSELLSLTLEKVLAYDNLPPIILEFAEACLKAAPEKRQFVDIIMLNSIKTGYGRQRALLATRFAKLCPEYDPTNTEILGHLSVFYQNSYQYQEGIDTAQKCYDLSENLAQKVYGNHLVIKSFMSASGYWQKVQEKILYQESLINEIVAQSPTNIPDNDNIRLYNSAFFFPYIRDDASKNRMIQNNLSQICYQNVQTYAQDIVAKYNYRSRTNLSKDPHKKLRIGYISHCLRNHSVGWISRWLFKHHDREKFDVYAYMVATVAINDFSQYWFVNNTTECYRFEMPGIGVVQRIYEDEIDILIDLDSVTLDTQCEILSIKPAPIQVSWLGWDAPGLPSMDYFIADDYVVPENAQDYYQEKIWKLPETYVAVDGFEVGLATFKRANFNIPDDGIIYFVAQKGYKRHPENARLQMQIIKAVPNSYLLIKGVADQDSSKAFYEEIATEIGVECDRLKFLPLDSSEPEHRANLAMADVVLDTYPYNGATTTLETLWVGVPLVTKVGQQFSARNSYGMMMNVGVTEGIAWTDEEYLEWGIKFGTDENLRREVAWKLRQSRKNAPLWNGEKFAREMEKAYQQMWEIYCQS
jgi:predicted O-linked N-acetylglucosamine transferase (SPINDLY family)